MFYSDIKCSVFSFVSSLLKEETLVSLPLCVSLSEDVRARGFTVVVDMRGSKWDSVKPVLRTLQESFSSNIHTALLIKPDTFWQKHKTNLGSAKFSFEVPPAVLQSWVLDLRPTGRCCNLKERGNIFKCRSLMFKLLRFPECPASRQ